MPDTKRYQSENQILNKFKSGIKGTLLFLMPLPVLLAAIIHLLKGQIFSSLIAGGLFAGFMLAGSIARYSFKREYQFQQSKLAKPPSKSYKALAALILSITTALTAFLLSDYSLFSSIFIGFTTFLAFYMAYGMKPHKERNDKLSQIDNAEEVIEALKAAEIQIKAIETARLNIHNITFNQHLKRIIEKARTIVALIEDDPKDLSRARKFLKVYLLGTVRVTESYAKTHNKDATTDALDSNFQEVLDSIEKTFDEQHKKLLENDQFDLDVKIDVLKAQLKNI